jgi:hypothetical protein
LTLTEYHRLIRPVVPRQLARRFETGPGQLAQVDFADFQVSFTSEPRLLRTVWLFSMVLGQSRWLWARVCPNHTLETVIRDGATSRPSPRLAAADRGRLGRMKTAVIGEHSAGVVTCNESLVALLAHYESAPRVCPPYRAKPKAKVERPFRYVRQDFFLGRSFRDLDDLNAQFEDWRVTIANPRVHATTQRFVDDHFAGERPYLLPLPLHPYDAVLTVERRISQEGMVAVGGNQYSVPDTTRRRRVEIQNHPAEVRIFEDGRLIASRSVLGSKNQRRIDHGRRNPVPVARRATSLPTVPVDAPVDCRPLAFYEADGRRLANAPEDPRP